jgi:hypothetical protein
MRRAEGAQTPYEVYCHHCRVTFPAEARRCVHCGQRLRGPAAPAGEARSLPELLGQPADPSRPHGPADAAEEEVDESMQALRRFGVPAVWVLVAISAVLSNMCEGRG